MIACKRLENLEPRRESNLFKKSPRYRSSSLKPFAMTVTRSGAAQPIALPSVKFCPWNRYVAVGIAPSANAMNPMEPTERPSLSLPLDKKMDDRLSPDNRVSPTIDTVTRQVLESKLRAILSTGDDWKLKNALKA